MKVHENIVEDDVKDPEITSLGNNDEADTDNALDKLVDMANTQDANLNVFAAKLTESNPLGHIQADISSLFAKVKNLKLSLSHQVVDKIDDLVPRMTVKKVMPKLDKRVKKTLNAKVPNIILKPLNREFNALNIMESRRIVILQKKLGKAIRTTVGNYVKRNAKKQITEIPRDILVINARQLVTKVEKNATDIHELVELVHELVRLIDPVPTSANTATKGEKTTSEGPLTLKEEKLQMQEIKRDDLLPITKLSYKVNNSTKEATMRITRNNQPLNLTVYDKFMLKKLRFSEWLELHALASKREEEFHLSTTAQLIRVQNAIKINSVEAREMFGKMIYVIEARNDVVEARNIVQDNLDNLG
uniref:Uncharacterized protein n=1 Tax=Tanacetum cinerariifolium TaxID=118510 RepID=A0A6L2NYA9_TANCI|nr:hypothetical protein [Tanacetum cinerariifolium]